MSESNTDDEEGDCPVCGQPFDHSYKEQHTSMGAPELRADATWCKGRRIGDRRGVYVHLGDDDD